MTPGAVFFDNNFVFHDGSSSAKLLVVLGCKSGTVLIVKTTSKIYGKGITYGCQPTNRFHNFYLPQNCGHFDKDTWICLDEFYEISQAEMLQKRFAGNVKHICDINENITREIQDCAKKSIDISPHQELIIEHSLLSQS